MQIHKKLIEGTAIPPIEVQEAGIIETLARLCPGFLLTAGRLMNLATVRSTNLQALSASELGFLSPAK